MTSENKHIIIFPLIICILLFFPACNVQTESIGHCPSDKNWEIDLTTYSPDNNRILTEKIMKLDNKVEESNETGIEFIEYAPTDEMLVSVYEYIYEESYDPEDNLCKEKMTGIPIYDQDSIALSGPAGTFYAPCKLNGFLFCYFTKNWVAEAITEYPIDEYVFYYCNVGSPSCLNLYLYKDGDFIMIEEAWEKELVTPKQVCDILDSDEVFANTFWTVPEK